MQPRYKAPQRHSNRNLRFRFRIDRRPDGKFQTSGTRVASVAPISGCRNRTATGDFITKVNGNNVSSKNTGLLENGNGTVLTVSTLSADEETGELVWDDEATELTLPAAVHMENNPLFLYKVIEQDGRKTGYLVYNEFKAGINDGDASYLEQMLQIFQWFKQQGVTDFILDLRYNQGGQVTCAQLLASLLAPAGSLGQEFARFEFNDKRQDSNYSLNFSRNTRIII